MGWISRAKSTGRVAGAGSNASFSGGRAASVWTARADSSRGIRTAGRGIVVKEFG
jgi:hypothetical protein